MEGKIKRPFLLNFYILTYFLMIIFGLGFQIYKTIIVGFSFRELDLLRFLISVIFSLVIIYGFWNLRPWARKLALIINYFWVGSMIVMVCLIISPDFIKEFKGTKLTTLCCEISLSLMYIHILERKDTKQAFTPLCYETGPPISK